MRVKSYCFAQRLKMCVRKKLFIKEIVKIIDGIKIKIEFDTLICFIMLVNNSVYKQKSGKIKKKKNISSLN